MKKFVTLLTVIIAILMFALPQDIHAQVFVADGYKSVLELNKFQNAPHYPIVADEVHAGYDLDKDGNKEFIFLADHSDPNGPTGFGWNDGHSVYVYEWNPTSKAYEYMWSWSDTTNDNGGASFPTMAVTDLDGDGDQEIVLGVPHGTNHPGADVSPTTIYVFEFGSNGLPTEPSATWTAGAAPGANTRPAAMAAGDIDGDGAQEVAVAFRKYSTAATNDALMIFSLDGAFAGPFTQFKTEMIDTTGDWGSVYAADITDLDNDGNLEAYFSTDNHTVYEATGPDTYALSYVPSPKIGPWTIQATAQGDIDGDGKNELVFGKTNGSVGLWYGITDVSKTDSTNEALIAEVEPGGCRGLTVGDFDGNGKTDIFVGGNYSGSVWRMEYNGSGAITDSASYTYTKVYQDSTPLGSPRVYSVSFPGDNFSAKQGGMTSNDMDGNGLPELMIAYEDGDSLQSWIVMLEATSTVGIELNPGQKVLRSFSLNQNYPNPFNPTTTISYQVPSAQKVTLKIYDMLGKEVKTLVDNTVGAGTHSVVWNGTNNAGSKIGSGVYIYTLRVGHKLLTRRMTLLK